MSIWQKPNIKPTIRWALCFLGLGVLWAAYNVFYSQPITNPGSLWVRLRVGGLASASGQKFTLLDWDAKNKIWNFEWQTQGDYLRGLARLEIEASKGQELLQKRKQELLSIYSNAIDPYFASGGQQTMACAPQWRMQEIAQNTESSLYRAYATERFAYRACDPDSAFYQLDILYIYCREARVWLELEYFHPRRAEPLDPALSLAKFSCNSSS